MISPLCNFLSTDSESAMIINKTNFSYLLQALSVLTRCIKRQQDIIKGNWDSSEATEHTKECHGQFSWVYPRTITVMSNIYKRKVRETHEINRLKTFKALNRDNDDYVTMNSWKPLFWKNKKLLNYNFDVRFCVSLKTAFSKLSRNITTCQYSGTSQ